MTSTTVLRAGVAVACAALIAFSASAQRATQADVQDLADRWASAYNRHDRAALGAVYGESARLMMHGATTISGRKAIEDFWAGDFEASDPLTLLKVTNTVTGSDMLLVHGDYEVISQGRQRSWRRPVCTSGRATAAAASGVSTAICGTSPSIRTRQPKLRRSKKIQELAARWTGAYNQHDRAALQALYANDARLLMHGAPTIASRAAIGEFWAQDFGESNPLTLLKVTHAIDGVDMVLVHGNYEVVDRTDGTKVGLGRFAHIWTAAPNGGWLLDRDLWYERSEPAP